MVAGKNVAVVFEGESTSAFFAKNAERRGNARPCTERDIEELDKSLSDIATDPNVVDFAEKIAVVARFDGPRRNERIAERSRGEIRRSGEAHRCVVCACRAFDERDELNKTGARFAQKFVNVERVADVVFADDGERVELGTEALELLHSGENEVERRRSRTRKAACVVQLARSVDAQAHEETVVGKKRGPIFVDERAVGLKCVFDFFAVGVFFFEFENFFEKIDSEKRGFAALPDELDLGNVLRTDVIADEALEYFVTHARHFRSRVKPLFFKVVAIGAVEVAQRADRFGHDVERSRRGFFFLGFHDLRERRKSKTAPVFPQIEICLRQISICFWRGVVYAWGMARANSHYNPDVAILKHEESDIPELVGSLGHDALVLVLDGIQDPHNLGAILRTADCAGVDFVVITKRRSAPVTETVRRIACGGAESVPIVLANNLRNALEKLKACGVWVAGTSDHKTSSSIYNANLKGPLAIVMGAEGDGIRHLTGETCDFLVRIPMLGSVPCLNVSVATGVCLFEALRQRGVR